ncbi:MAG TPA: hypothetical protein VHT27_07730 [Solirubrobacteraceae bacterium]|nr:hypothetical protein [Solirubrobacteraceae bacterium]
MTPSAGRAAARARQARLGGPALALALAALLLLGCGGVRAADLFIVTRTGPQGQRLTLLVDEEGGASCNGGAMRKISDPQLVLARGIQEELHDAASRNRSFPAQPKSVFSYRVRDEAGTVTFADNAAGQPKVLRQLALFVLQVSQQVCGL